MKTRNGFVSNSSSSSFIIGYGSKETETKYYDVFNIVSLIEIKKQYIKNSIEIPKEIRDIEKHFNGPIENITKDSIYKKERKGMEIKTIKHYEDFISFNVKDIPSEVDTIEISFVSE